jgi:hypothetical protein
MRSVAFAIALFAVSAIGQQAPVDFYPAVSIDLPVEPVHAPAEVTLLDAAQRNDFPTFDAIFTASGDDAFAELHRFWKWSLTDPLGGFYGDDQYAAFAAEYPDYAAFIEDYRIVDSHGRSFYPSSETRSFLLRHAVNRDVPRKHVAPAPVVAPRVVPASRRPEARPEGATTPKPVIAVVTETPAPIVAPKPVIAVVTESPAPIVAPRVVPASRQSEGRPEGSTTAVRDARLGRALVLLIVGLIGVGVLTLMLRTPKEPARST